MNKQFFFDLWRYWGSSKWGGFLRFMVPFYLLLSLVTLSLQLSQRSRGSVANFLVLVVMIGVVRRHHSFWMDAFSGTIAEKMTKRWGRPSGVFVLSDGRKVAMLETRLWKQAQIGDFIEKAQGSFEMTFSQEPKGTGTILPAPPA